MKNRSYFPKFRNEKKGKESQDNVYGNERTPPKRYPTPHKVKHDRYEPEEVKNLLDPGISYFQKYPQKNHFLG